jgi:hypothetical protein
MTISEYPTIPQDFQDEHQHRRMIARAVSLAQLGKTNNVLDVTLANNDTKTTISDARIGATTFPIPMPTHADSWGMAKLPYVTDSGRVNGSFIVSHSAVASSNLNFKFILVG